MAQYGLNISDVNTILRTAFAGNVAGVVFEGEKRFDMVVRLQRKKEGEDARRKERKRRVSREGKKEEEEAFLKKKNNKSICDFSQ